ncbi:hypothetical protein SESBI_05611 [Sesbania bispinosa]|nr:hypothetical protein SESBI_05611 [Sesbania bispinosa]
MRMRLDQSMSGILNKNAKSKWVAKAVTDRFRSGQNTGHNTRKCPTRPVVEEPEPNTQQQSSAAAPVIQRYDGTQGTNDQASQNPEPPKNNSKGKGKASTSTSQNAKGPKGKGQASTKAQKGKGPTTTKAKKGKGLANKPCTSTAADNLTPEPVNSASTAVNPPPAPINPPPAPVNPHPAPVNPPTADVNPHPVAINPPPASINQQPDWSNMTTSDQIRLLKNVHQTTMYMQQLQGTQLPPYLKEANNILHNLMVVAQEVTSAKAYDWKKVASQLGLSDNEPYMNFINQDEAKNLCGFQDYDCTTTCDGSGGTQTSDVTTTNKDA